MLLEQVWKENACSNFKIKPSHNKPKYVMQIKQNESKVAKWYYIFLYKVVIFILIQHWTENLMEIGWYKLLKVLIKNRNNLNKWFFPLLIVYISKSIIGSSNSFYLSTSHIPSIEKKWGFFIHDVYFKA